MAWLTRSGNPGAPVLCRVLIGPLRPFVMGLLLSVAPAAFGEDVAPAPPGLNALLSKSGPGQGDRPNDGLANLRYDALRAAAYKYGVQSGAAHRQHAINTMLAGHQGQLDRISMGPLLLPGNLLPPSLSESEANASLGEGGALLALADKHYRIVEPARYVLTAPGWREFLWHHYPAPEEPDPALWPDEDEEWDAWKESLQAGWDDGETHADEQFRADLARWVRAYTGRILFWRLLEQNILAPPDVMTAVRGVVRDEDGLSLWVNDRYRQIVAPARFQQPPEQWAPVLGHAMARPLPAPPPAVTAPAGPPDGPLHRPPAPAGLIAQGSPDTSPAPVPADAGAPATAPIPDEHADSPALPALPAGLPGRVEQWRAALLRADKRAFVSLYSAGAGARAGQWFERFHRTGDIDLQVDGLRLVEDGEVADGRPGALLALTGSRRSRAGDERPVHYRQQWVRDAGHWYLSRLYFYYDGSEGEAP